MNPLKIGHPLLGVPSGKISLELCHEWNSEMEGRIFAHKSRLKPVFFAYFCQLLFYGLKQCQLKSKGTKHKKAAVEVCVGTKMAHPTINILTCVTLTCVLFPLCSTKSTCYPASIFMCGSSTEFPGTSP